MNDKSKEDVALTEIGSATIWDASEHKHGGFAIRHRTIEELRALRDGDHAIGPAYTVRMRRAAKPDPANREGFLTAYDKAPEGAVVVVQVENDIGGVAMGDLVAHRLAERGVAGVVIDGAIRDQVALKDIAPPSWYRYMSPAGPVSREVRVEIGTDVVIGGVVVRPGDLVVGDIDGLMVTPAEEAEEILDAARSIVMKEAAIHERLVAKESLRSILMGIKDEAE